MKRLIAIVAVIIVLVGLWSAPISSQAQSPSAPLYALRGEHPVGVADLTVENGDRPLQVTMWYPALNPDGAEELTIYQMGIFERSGQALRDGLPNFEDGPYPVIYFSHGLGGTRLESTYYTEHLASWGFVVMAADHPGSTFFDMTSTEDITYSFAYRPLEILRLIQYSDEINTAGNYAGLLDMEALAVTGYSFGGYSTLAAGGANINFAALGTSCDEVPEGNNLCDGLKALFQMMAEILELEAVPDGLWPAISDSRIKAVVPLAPVAEDIFGTGVEGTAGITAPLMIMVGTSDPYVAAENHAIPALENASSKSKSLVLFENAGHSIYVDECTKKWIELGLSDSCSDAVWDMADAHNVIKHLATAFFLAHLKGDTDAANALLPGAVDFIGVEYTVTGS